MKKNRIFIIILFCIIAFSACEKDDICVDGNTPLLVIRFYDTLDPESTKNVTTLRVVGSGQASTVNTYADRSTADSLAIPLRPDVASTTYLLIANSATEDEVETGNTDTLTINHDTKEVYISRACGFIANYENLAPTLTTDTDNWIKGIEVISPTVENSNTAHVKIFH
ncbi:DUF6452 family protein [Maribacter sp. HTCC2170]|uniref:DUF6452 family protein n=1 Tax=Maribacter sp. (strain HTCC2170 / KCCM 42371) TaxID=313603 RepID=UPI00006B499D|nr:DUF6452 family protein [Maribacter sp. HTCC2170]EAR00918.1 hypothetical protein FB2170_09111 [Maribacter sp. HTCC2170]